MDSKDRKYFLLLVEGEKTETKFFVELLKNTLGEVNVHVVANKCHIFELYKHIKELELGTHLTELELALSTLPKFPEDERKKIEDIGLYAAKFLIFDFDYQATEFSNEEKIKRIQELAEYFNEEIERGLLLINYPMFESVREKELNVFYSYEEGKYKRTAHERGRMLDLKKLKHEDYLTLISNSINNVGILLNKEIDLKDLIDTWESPIVLQKQIDLLKEKGCILCLNTSVQIPLIYKGEDLFKKLHIKRKK